MRFSGAAIALVALFPLLPVQAQTSSPGSQPETEPEKTPRVADLEDVRPTDWAYQALRSLVEKYQVISGYPNGAFQGNRPLTRNEFAAVLNAAIQRINALLTEQSGTVLGEDVRTLRRLQTDYRNALASLDQRLTRMETLTTSLETQHFSPTTTLNGETVLGFTVGSQANPTLITQSELTLTTSFSGQDELLIQLETGNEGLDAIAAVQSRGINLLGVQGILANGGGLEFVDSPNTVELKRSHYTWRVTPDLALTLGPKLSPQDWIDQTRFAIDPSRDFSSSFFSHNPLIIQNPIDQAGGAGAALDWKPVGSPFRFRGLYVAAEANNPQAGLFGGNQNQASAELEYTPNSNWVLRLQYTTATVNQTQIQALGLNTEWQLNRRTTLFARYGFGTYQGWNSALEQNLDLRPQTWAVGLAIQDVGIPGTLAGLALGQPFAGQTIGNATQTNFEAFYNLLLSDNISITPTLSLVTNANNDRANPTIWQGTLRTVFSF